MEGRTKVTLQGATQHAKPERDLIDVGGAASVFAIRAMGQIDHKEVFSSS
jgi:hypothetical protein